jgi:glycosyltransferase involved in cell wall biosynthesis
MPTVSVLIASHRPHLLPYALESVWAQRGISQADIQVLVNYCQDPANFQTAWNRLAQIATGRYLVILGDDDTLEPDYLAAAVATLDETGADIAHSNVRLAHRSGPHVTDRDRYFPPTLVTLTQMVSGNKIWQSSVVRAATWHMVGGYDMTLEYVHDWDFWVRVFKSGGTAVHLPMLGWTHYTHDGHRVTTSSNHERAKAALYAKHPDLLFNPQA